MTGKRLFIKADEVCSDRFLHHDEMFKKEKNWNINLPKERQFANGECIITDKDDTAYSIDELINLLNYLHRTHYPLKKENKSLTELKNRCCANSHNAHQFLRCYEKAVNDLEDEYEDNPVAMEVLDKLDEYYTKYERMVDLE